jgi:hypothetical protein
MQAPTSKSNKTLGLARHGVAISSRIGEVFAKNLFSFPSGALEQDAAWTSAFEVRGSSAHHTKSRGPQEQVSATLLPSQFTINLLISYKIVT